MMAEITAPRWALELVAAIERHEDTHAKDAACFAAVLDRVPDDVRLYARAFEAGYRTGVDGAAGG